ncbi:hypothetical protein TRIATDRAFT_36827 [Trichoderma atroviride IMI 206040]|uniref:FAD-binding PCMH-type domain-containing protein n=1 Tax=Hypocrea atroviridis (strain ATCC 20476 / IMI 206040) TaxID=452589 RepID=G9NYA9_HYPAI|nr:uncharacterized protein TRIATDRAFT_36827 [Trichoderma atroviride IMI 206040]EHK44434.1 hypothetical protein TRIATDRAFT_36827 [Trichoderma atroviride IMI 206040]
MARHLLLWTSFLISASVGCSVDNVASLFGSSLSYGAEISICTDRSFNETLTPRWDIFTQPTFSTVIKPATNQDVQNIVSPRVKIAGQHQIPFSVTSGGGGVTTTLSKLQDGLAINLANFQSVSLDTTQNTLTVGGGVVFSQIIDVLFKNGKELPIASVSCLGVISTTLGGGWGSLQGLRGLLIDNLLSVQLVTASGDLITVSATQNPDLFWALRGAGQNFGIVTSATYKVYDATNGGQVVNADFAFTAADNGSVWEYMQSYDESLPANMALSGFAFANATTREATLWVNVIYFGTVDEAMPHLEPLIAMNPTNKNISMVPWNEEISQAYFGVAGNACTANNRVNIYHAALKQTHVPTWESYFANLTQFYLDYPAYAGRVVIQKYSSEAVAAVPDSQTAYPLRDTKTMVLFEGWYTDPTLDGPVNSFMKQSRQSFAATSGYDSLSTYVNYAHGDEGPVAWYSTRKLTKLMSLKKQWDPKNLFGWYNAIPTN